MAPIFFLSYARDDGGQALSSFFEALVKAVRVKFGGAADGMGFLDTEAIPIGGEWPRRLSEALAGCRVFVPLYSPSFFSRPYCGKEWAVFRGRQDAYAAARAAPRPELVIPVLWGAREDLPPALPGELPDVQFDNAVFPRAYAENGLDVLMRLNKYEDERQEVIEALARSIKRAHDGCVLPALDPLPTIDAVQELFPVRADVAAAPPVPGTTAAPAVVGAGGGPRFVQLVLVAGARDEFRGAPAPVRANADFYGSDCFEWRPYQPAEERRLSALASQVAAERDFIPDTPTERDEALLAKLKEASAQNKIVVLLVDTWTLRIKRYFDLMQSFDEKNYLNSAVLVLWDGDVETASSEAELDRLTRLAFRNRALAGATGMFVSPVKSAADFRRHLGDALEAARSRMRQYADLMREAPSAGPSRPTL